MVYANTTRAHRGAVQRTGGETRRRHARGGCRGGLSDPQNQGSGGACCTRWAHGEDPGVVRRGLTVAEATTSDRIGNLIAVLQMSAFGPKQTWPRALHMSAFDAVDGSSTGARVP